MTTTPDAIEPGQVWRDRRRRPPIRQRRLGRAVSPRPVSTAFVVEGTKFANLNGSRGNHHAHQALMDTWKSLAILAIRKTGCRPVDAPVVITATVRRTRNGKADAHNVTPTIKAVIDAAVACGLIEDDHDGIVSRLVIEAGPKAPKPTIELRIDAA